jgi:hypothetical protein
MYDDLAAASRARGNAQLLAWGLYASARALIPLGELEQARAMLLEAHAMLEHQNDAPSRIICPGLLALVHLALGDSERADAFARIAEARIRKNAPTVFSTVDGYAAVAEVRVEQWRRAIVDRGDVAGARARARRSLAALGVLAYSLPIGRPYFHRLRGRALLVSGREAAARRWFGRGLAASKRLAMPYQEALAEASLGALDPPGEARRRRLARAEELFVHMKCTGDLARLRALAG